MYEGCMSEPSSPSSSSSSITSDTKSPARLPRLPRPHGDIMCVGSYTVVVVVGHLRAGHEALQPFRQCEYSGGKKCNPCRFTASFSLVCTSLLWLGAHLRGPVVGFSRGKICDQNSTVAQENRLRSRCVC